MASIRGAPWHIGSAFLFLGLVSSACSSTTADAPRAAPDSGTSHQNVVPDAGVCAKNQKAYQDFVQSHRTCSADSDCTLIGDCGPHLFDVVRTDAATEAARLQSETCAWGFDGPLYDAVCSAGTCTLRETGRQCGAPFPLDAGPEASTVRDR